MKKLDFGQMENIQGGDSCFAEGAVFLLSAIASLGSTGFTAGLSWGLTAWAAKEYVLCQAENVEAAAAAD
jgi:hypothetical protein